jgi:hypothetical protein
MAVAGLEEAASLMLASKQPRHEDADFDDFLSRVTEVQQQIQLLKEGVDPSSISTVSAKKFQERFKHRSTQTICRSMVEGKRWMRRDKSNSY